jgi:hypothetical protein
VENFAGQYSFSVNLVQMKALVELLQPLNKTHTNETQIIKGLHWEQRDMTAGS